MALNDTVQMEYQEHLKRYKIEELGKDLGNAKIKMKVEAVKSKGLKVTTLMSKVNMMNKAKSPKFGAMDKLKHNLKAKVRDSMFL